MRFKMNPGDPLYELGILINEGDGRIMDMDGKIVMPRPWSWHTTNEHVMTVKEV